jgi:hypothetical protein
VPSCHAAGPGIEGEHDGQYDMTVDRRQAASCLIGWIAQTNEQWLTFRQAQVPSYTEHRRHDGHRTKDATSTESKNRHHEVRGV